jgi:hypothetical protein
MYVPSTGIVPAMHATFVSTMNPRANVRGAAQSAALSFKPLRKTIGLLLVILGSIACFTIIGLVLGVPMIIIGGIFLFI